MTTAGWYTADLGTYSPLVNDIMAGNDVTINAVSPVTGGAVASIETNRYSGGVYQAQLIVTTVPEPSSILALLTGVVGLTGLLRKRLA